MGNLSEKDIIAKRIAQEVKDGDVINLGIGLPTLVANYIPEGINVFFQAENGILGMGPEPEKGKEDVNIINAGGVNVTVVPGAAFFDSATSFSMIRGGHVDMTVLGALQVSERGDLASHIIPGKMVPGMGGAMDLVAGAKKVIVAMIHTAKGRPKILKECTLPLTAKGRVNMIVTEKGVIEVTPEGLMLVEVSPYSSVEDIVANTEAKLIIKEGLK
jgi:acetate CoA/acetoacetate CoA-transferase beta subunit